MTALARSTLLVLAAAASSCQQTTTSVAVTQNALTEDAPFVQLLRSAPLVVRARVERVVGRDGTMGRAEVPAIYSDVSLTVLSQVGNPTPGRSLAVTLLGGEVGDRAHHVSGQVQLSKNDEFIGFIDPNAMPHPFIGGTGGVFRIIDGSVSSFDGRDVVQVTKDGFVLAPRPVESGRLPVGQGTATGLQDRAEGPALSANAVLEALELLRAR